MKDEASVVIMAAGLGTRMRSRKAKVLHRAGGQTLVEHVLDAAAAIAPPQLDIQITGRWHSRSHPRIAGLLWQPGETTRSRASHQVRSIEQHAGERGVEAGPGKPAQEVTGRQ